MPETSQVTFAHKEVLELLIKRANIHEGKWMLSVTFAFSGANIGPTPDQVIPAAVVGIQSLGIQKAQPDSPDSLVLDAAIINPA